MRHHHPLKLCILALNQPSHYQLANFQYVCVGVGVLSSAFVQKKIKHIPSTRVGKCTSLLSNFVPLISPIKMIFLLGRHIIFMFWSLSAFQREMFSLTTYERCKQTVRENTGLTRADADITFQMNSLRVVLSFNTGNLVLIPTKGVSGQLNKSDFFHVIVLILITSSL